MKSETPLLPDGVAESWFHVHAGGEVWTSRVCRGADLLKVLDELMGADARDAERLADADNWYVLDGKCRSISFACGEDPDIQITMIEDKGFSAHRGAGLIAEERKRQILEEDYNASHDDSHDRGELIAAAMCYASVPLLRLTYKPFQAEAEITEVMATKWPWDEECWKPDNDATRNLVKAGALIAAEIDRLERLKP